MRHQSREGFSILSRFDAIEDLVRSTPDKKLNIFREGNIGLGQTISFIDEEKVTGVRRYIRLVFSKISIPYCTEVAPQPPAKSEVSLSYQATLAADKVNDYKCRVQY